MPTTTLAPIADTYVHEYVPSEVRGSWWEIDINGSSPSIIPLFRFTLPSGTFTAARLYLTFQNDAHNALCTVYAQASGTWSEATATWSNRPTLSGVSVGTFTPASTPDPFQQYTITLDHADLQPYAGGDLTLYIISAKTGTPVGQMLAREHGTAAVRPVLEIDTSVGGGAASAIYSLTITHDVSTSTIASRTYEIDATASTGDATLTQTAGTTVSKTESPADVFTFDDPGGTDTLTFTLTATDGTDVDTKNISIVRGGGATSTVRPLVLRHVIGADLGNVANWR